MTKAIYIMCGLTSVGCAVLLVRHYLRTRGTLLLLSSVFFMTMAVTNILLYIDLVVIPDIDLSILRNLIAIIGLIFLLVGLIWETT